MARSPNLDAARVRTVMAIIKALPGLVTWDRIVRAIGEEKGWLYTRQALQSHGPIKATYEARRAAPGIIGRRPSARARAASERDARQRLRIAELEETVDRYHERFAAMIYNAEALKGITPEQLLADLQSQATGREQRGGTEEVKKRGLR